MARAKERPMLCLPFLRTHLHAACHVPASIAAFGSVLAEWRAIAVEPLDIFKLRDAEVLCSVTVGVGVVVSPAMV
jgi:hypothetical protein